MFFVYGCDIITTIVNQQTSPGFDHDQYKQKWKRERDESLIDLNRILPHNREVFLEKSI